MRWLVRLGIIVTVGCGPKLADDMGTGESASGDSSSASTSTATQDDGANAEVDDGYDPFPPDWGSVPICVCTAIDQCGN